MQNKKEVVKLMTQPFSHIELCVNCIIAPCSWLVDVFRDDEVGLSGGTCSSNGERTVRLKQAYNAFDGIWQQI